jgi:hypothetical protein
MDASADGDLSRDVLIARISRVEAVGAAEPAG